MSDEIESFLSCAVTLLSLLFDGLASFINTERKLSSLVPFISTDYWRSSQDIDLFEELAQS